jgi:hypothetical protein
MQPASNHSQFYPARASLPRLDEAFLCGLWRTDIPQQFQRPLILKRASASRPSGQWSDDDYDVLEGEVVVGRIMKAAASPVGTPWLWTLAFGHHEDRPPGPLPFC